MFTCFAMVLWTRRGSPAPEPLVCSISSARVPPDDGDGDDHEEDEDVDDHDHDHAQEDNKDYVKEDGSDRMRRCHDDDRWSWQIIFFDNSFLFPKNHDELFFFIARMKIRITLIRTRMIIMIIFVITRMIIMMIITRATKTSSFALLSCSIYIPGKA